MPKIICLKERMPKFSGPKDFYEPNAEEAKSLAKVINGQAEYLGLFDPLDMEPALIFRADEVKR